MSNPYELSRERQMRQKIRRLISAGILGTAALFGAMGGCWAITDRWEVAEGERVGMVNKLSKKGFFFKTLEGQMALEGLSGGGDTVGANTWDFAIDNYLPQEEKDALTDKLRESMDTSKKVKVTYRQMAWTFSWRSGSNYLIQDVMPISRASYREDSGVPKEVSAESDSAYNKNLKVRLDDREYLLRHDEKGKLKVIELKELTE